LNVVWLVWSVFGVMALLWTAGAWSVAALTGWVAELVGSGQAFEIGKAVAAWPIPAWLTYWVDIGAIHFVLDALVQGLEALRGAWPAIGSALGWLVPLVWVGWGLGLALLLAAALGLHLLTRPARVAAA
jgi:hypothetical protein